MMGARQPLLRARSIDAETAAMLDSAPEDDPTSTPAMEIFAHRLRVGLVVGRAPDEDLGRMYCGVRDYAGCLAQALRDSGIKAEVIAPRSWGIKDGLSFVRTLRSSRLDVIHLQYPSIGHRFSLLPHFLGFTGVARCSVVTLHEHSAMPFIQRSANAIFRATADALVFTTDYEASSFGVSAPRLVIPIGSNVPIHNDTPERDNRVLYFGQIRAGKGLEAFIALAQLANAAGEPGRFLVIGSAPPRWLEYARALRASAPANVSWVENAPATAIAEAMATAAASYLPFPDGAGFRRGSMLAALANGLPVIAPLGKSSTDELREVVFAAETPAQALDQLRLIMARPKLAAQRTIAGRRLVERYSWKAIAEQHRVLYRRLLANGTYRDTRSPLK